MKNPQESFDVIIIGSGMVGAALACALSESPIRVALLDRAAADSHWSSTSFDLRVSALTRASQHILANVGVWNLITAKRATPYHHMHVWDATGKGAIHFDCADIGEPDLGHIVENSAILASLHEKLGSSANCTMINDVSCNKISFGEKAFLTLSNGATLNAKLVVGADGAQSWLRAALGIQTTGWSYEQKAIVATVRTSNGNGRTAWQRFLPTGPLAFLPLDDDYSSIVWSTREADAEHLLLLNDKEFLYELNKALGETGLGDAIETSKRAAFPLRLQHANQYQKERAVLIGDAAHTVHPLAGQGVNLGFLDAATLAEVVLDALEQKRDIGSMQLLRRYERARKADNLIMMGAMDGFKRLFSNETPSLSLVRNLGLSLTNRLTPVKNALIRQAMGIDGRQPDLAKRICD